MREKDKERLTYKIEEAINTLSLEHYLDLPDWKIAELLVGHFEYLVKFKESSDSYKVESRDVDL